MVFNASYLVKKHGYPQLFFAFTLIKGEIILGANVLEATMSQFTASILTLLMWTISV